MASIQRIASPLTGEVRYRAQVRVKGRPSESQTFPTKKEAREWAQALESAIRQGRNFPHTVARRTDFSALIERYRKTVLGSMPEKAQSGRALHLDWWSQRFADLTVAEITPDRIAEARDALLSEPYRRGRSTTTRRRSGATVNRYLATLSHMFSVALKEWRLVERNPVRDVTKRKESRGRTRFLTDEECERLLGACRDSEWSGLYPLVLLALTTGARRSELIGLQWADVDLKVGRATLHTSKNSEPRVLPLVGKALEELRVLKLSGGARSAHVFANLSGAPGAYENFDAYWYAALKAAEIQDFRFHDLRHTAASMLAAQGCSLLEIADVLGHKSITMTRRYSHLLVEHKKSVIEKMVKAKGL